MRRDVLSCAFQPRMCGFAQNSLLENRAVFLPVPLSALSCFISNIVCYPKFIVCKPHKFDLLQVEYFESEKKIYLIQVILQLHQKHRPKQ